MLQGHRLSVVQAFGLELIIFLDNLMATEQRTNAIKLALLSGGTVSVETLYPEWFRGAPADDEDREEVEEDYTDVQWMLPSGGDQQFEELLRLQEELANNAISVTDLPGGGEWT